MSRARATPGPGLPAALLAALLTSGGAGCGSQAEPTRPNVLWISIDTLRADRLSCYGNEQPTSPAIDRLAAQGVLFERAVSTTSWTLPAHVSMFTGLPVSVHGVCHHEYLGESPARGVQVPELLQQAGWRTGGFFTHAYLGSPFVFGPGFDTWERAGRVYNQSQAVRARWEAARAAGRKREARALIREHAALFDRGAPEADATVERAIEWLGDGQGPQPFFLFVHLFDVHSPYRPPPPFDRRFDPEYEGEVFSINVDEPNSPVRAGMDPADLRHVVALYDGEIAWVDSQVERLLARLDTLGVADETLVILTSDHGEEFLEHGATGHRRTLYTESLHVPLIVRQPGAFAGGRRVSAPVSLTDLAPTVLAACGVPPPAGLTGLDLAGLVAPGANGANGASGATARTLVSELVRVENDKPTVWKLALTRADELVIVHQAGTPQQTAERFDLAEDPRGAGPGVPILADTDGGRALALELEALRVRLRGLREAQPRATARAAPQLDELEEGTLAALGYTGFDVEPEGAQDGRLCMDGCVWRR